MWQDYNNLAWFFDLNAFITSNWHENDKIWVNENYKLWLAAFGLMDPIEKLPHST